MKKIRVKLYKTPWKLKMKYFFNWLISIRSLSKYSHIGIWTPDDDGNFQGDLRTDIGDAIGLFIFGKCWTATMRGKDNGTVVRDASKVLKHPGNWDYIEIEIDDWDYETLIEIMQAQVNINGGYGTWDILKFVLPIHFPDDGRYICSEFVNNMLCRIDVITGCGIVLPSIVAKKLTKKGYKIQSLT